MAAHESTFQPTSRAGKWLDERLPLPRVAHGQFVDFPLSVQIPENAGGKDFPRTPDLFFSLDFNRHGRNKTANKSTDQSLNVLFCDGHVASVSAREGWKAIYMQ